MFTLFNELARQKWLKKALKKEWLRDPLTFLHDVEIALPCVHFVQTARVTRLLKMRASKLESQSLLNK